MDSPEMTERERIIAEPDEVIMEEPLKTEPEPEKP